MLVLAHVGLTVGMAQAVEHIAKNGGNGKAGLRLDYRLVVLGSMLPDLIDKPLGHFILRDTLNNGRIYCHTLAFALIFLVFALIALRLGKAGLMVVWSGLVVHLVLDGIWRAPATLFWPLYGWSFPALEYHFFWDTLKNLAQPHNFIPELMGAAVLLGHGLRLRFFGRNAGVRIRL